MASQFIFVLSFGERIFSENISKEIVEDRIFKFGLILEIWHSCILYLKNKGKIKKSIFNELLKM